MNNTQAFFRDKAVLVTGASSGIGEELGWQLTQAGAKLTLAARRTELLDHLAQRIAGAGRLTPVVVRCDVTYDRDLQNAVAESVQQRGNLEVVMENGAVGYVGG